MLKYSKFIDTGLLKRPRPSALQRRERATCRTRERGDGERRQNRPTRCPPGRTRQNRPTRSTVRDRASTPSTQANTSRCVSRSISRRVREIVEWSGVYSSSAMPAKRRSVRESASRHAIPRSQLAELWLRPEAASFVPQELVEVLLRHSRCRWVGGQHLNLARPSPKGLPILKDRQTPYPISSVLALRWPFSTKTDIRDAC